MKAKLVLAYFYNDESKGLYGEKCSNIKEFYRYLYQDIDKRVSEKFDSKIEMESEDIGLPRFYITLLLNDIDPKSIKLLGAFENCKNFRNIIQISFNYGISSWTLKVPTRCLDYYTLEFVD